MTSFLCGALLRQKKYFVSPLPGDFSQQAPSPCGSSPLSPSFSTAIMRREWFPCVAQRPSSHWCSSTGRVLLIGGCLRFSCQSRRWPGLAGVWPCVTTRIGPWRLYIVYTSFLLFFFLAGKTTGLSLAAPSLIHLPVRCCCNCPPLPPIDPPWLRRTQMGKKLEGRRERSQNDWTRHLWFLCTTLLCIVCPPFLVLPASLQRWHALCLQNTRNRTGCMLVQHGERVA